MRSPRLTFILSILAAVACTESLGPGTGAVRITVEVGGPDPDPAGFEVSVDGQSPRAIPDSGSVTLDLDMGHHTIVLAGGAARCTVSGSATKSVAINPGVTAEASFVVSCAALTGVVEVRGQSSGHDPDPDGYSVSLDGGPAQALLPNEVLRYAGVEGGTHSVSFSGLAPNCSATGLNPMEVIVSVGGPVRDTAQVTLSVTCAATTGAIRISAPTTGTSLDPAYAVAVDGGASRSFASGATIVVDFLAPGSRSVQLTGIASNCTVGGSNPLTASVVAGDTSEVVFSVTCTTPPRTGVDVILSTTGTNPDTRYYLSISGNCNDYYGYGCNVWFGPVPGNGTVEIDLSAGNYSFFLSEVAGNCTGPTSGSFTISNQQVTAVVVAVTCFSTGGVAVAVTASGVSVDPSYYVALDGVWQPQPVAAGGSVSLFSIVGTRAVGLVDVAPNCTVGGPNPVTVTVAPSATTNVVFQVTCVANPTLMVTVVTTGPNAPATYLVGVDPQGYYANSYAYTATILSNGTAPIILPPGAHTVTLDLVPQNCLVTSPNNVAVNVPPGEPTNLAFTVSCQ